MPSLDKRKQQLWENLESSLDKYFDQVRVQAQEAIELYKQNSMIALDKRIDDYINSYKEAVEILLSEQKTELERLSTLKESVKTDLSEIAERQNLLSSKREELIKVSCSSV